MKKLLLCLALTCLCIMAVGCEKEVQPEPRISPTPTSGPAATKTPAPESIEGKWKGRWEMFSCTGDWTGFERYSWDCWANVSADSIWLWDVDIPEKTGLAEIKYSKSGSAYTVEGGRFMDVKADYENWRMSLETGDKGPELVLRGNYEGNAQGRFSFAVYLEKDS